MSVNVRPANAQACSCEHVCHSWVGHVEGATGGGEVEEEEEEEEDTDPGVDCRCGRPVDDDSVRFRRAWWADSAAPPLSGSFCGFPGKACKSRARPSTGMCSENPWGDTIWDAMTSSRVSTKNFSMAGILRSLRCAPMSVPTPHFKYGRLGKERVTTGSRVQGMRISSMPVNTRRPRHTLRGRHATCSTGQFNQVCVAMVMEAPPW
mmetsp:Transcript_19495/g.49569  ORF Transcript_19495/g.49569 Transcript_19495/m.49569 type:complete len:206 (-) Transcript_19495:413-1030(-)